MKIIIDARTTQDEIKLNGVGRYSRLVIENIVRNNSDLEFILFMYDAPSTIDDLLSENLPNVTVKIVGKYLNGSTLKMLLYNLDLVFHISLNKALKEIGTDDSIFLSLYFWKGLPVFKIPTVVVIHDFALIKFNIYSTISPIHNIFRFVHYWMELLRVYFAKHIIVDSNYTYNDIFKYLPGTKKEKVSEVLLGVYQEEGNNDFEKYLPSDWNAREYLLYLGGGITANKNSKGVVDGYKAFVDKLQSHGRERSTLPYLVIAGKNFARGFSKEADKFNDYIKELEIEDLVHITGQYDDNSRWNLLENSFGFIHLSTFEGFGFGVAEAMRAKVPVIAHNGSTYPQVVGDGGLLVDGKNPQDVSDAILKLYSDREFAKELAQKGYEKSLEFDWNITAEKTVKVLKETFDGIN